jgi:uridine nucleosidase
LGAPRYASEVPGIDSLRGFEGLPDVDDLGVQMRFAFGKGGSPVRAIEGMAYHIRETWKNGAGNKVTIVATGPTTNIGMKTLLHCTNNNTKKIPIIPCKALFISVYPDLICAVEELVFMGGAVGLRNITTVAGLCNPAH